VKRSVILDRCVRAEFHTLVLISLFLLFAGHNQPGGGFVGGLVAGAALGLRFLAGGIDEVQQAARFHPFAIIGAGLLLGAATALAPLAMGDQLLRSAKATVDLPVVGSVHLSSSLVFDAGVYLVVVGLVLLMLQTLGEPDTDGSDREVVG
jgi:multisubunit Na+/H+ antiporter MnhB subunit